MSEHENYRRLKELQMIRDEERELLRKMLDQYMDSRDWIPVMQSAMGQGSSYIASVTLDWLATRVRFAHELPIFKEKHDPKTKKITIDQETIEMVRQRPIDHSRQFPMAQYLLLREHHKFPPVLAVLSSDWVDNPNSDNWTHDRAVTSVAEFQSLAGNGAIGLLRLSDKDTLYVLDGQHRLLAVKGALSLLQTGVLEELKPDGTSRENRITKEEIIQSQGVPESKLQHLRKEQIGVEIIPAVFQGEKYDEARRRVRRVFVHVNRLAAQLDKGTMSTLDEDNGFRIIAREIATVHPLFKGRVNFEKPNLTATSNHLSTLESLANGLKSYLEGRIPYRDWIPKLKNLVPERPDPEQLHEGVDEAKIFFDHFKELPIMRRVIQGEQLVQLREFKKADGLKHMLMRPIAQQAVMEAVGFCVSERNMEITDLFLKLGRLDEEGRLSDIDMLKSWWWGLLITQEGRMRNQRQRSVVELLIYLLGGYAGNMEKIRELVEVVGRQRTLLPPGEGIVDMEGNTIQQMREFRLPHPVT